MSERVLKQYVVDAFSDRVFGGNPAAVCVLEDWMPEELMLAIARENSLPETAFVLRRDGGYGLRWFAPGGEIDLCGHATLATAYVLFRFYEPGAGTLAFSTRSGTLAVTRRGDLYELDFPAFALRPVPVTEAMAAALGARPSEAFMGRDLLCVFDRAETVRALQPDLEAVKALEGLLVHATAPGEAGFDCVSRSFAPKIAVPEDPVCGSGHCHIIPYWSRRLGKGELVACQASQRGGTLYCRQEKDRVILAGKAALFAQAEIYVPGGDETP